MSRSCREAGAPVARRAAFLLALGLAFAGPAAAQAPPPEGAPPEEGFRPRLVREGTLSLGAQGGYGSLIGKSGFGRDYDGGPGLAVRVRYRTSRESAFGLSFEAQNFDAASGVMADTVLSVKSMRFIVTSLEYYQFFSVRNRAPRYLMAGVGLLQTRRKLQTDEVDFPGDAGVLTLGAGTEIWWKRWLTVDVSARYYGFGRKDEGKFRWTHGAQAAAGLHFYTSR